MARVPTRATGLFNVPRTRRELRQPQHSWHIRSRPWQIQPVAIAPVLPGETLRNILWQARVVTDPIRNGLIGWHKEYYWFYVKHRDLDGRDDFTEMMLDLQKDMSGYKETASVPYYTWASSIPWVKLCLKRIVEEYFRNEGEAWDIATIDGVPLASHKHAEGSLLHSLILASNLEAVDVDVDKNEDGTIQASEIELAMRQWEFLRQHNLVEMDYEQWLRTYGVRVRPEESHVPELIRYTSEWSYPVNTVDPTDGSAASAVSWAISGRADKDRFFKEPGFVVGLSVVRPKTYRRYQAGSGVCLLDDALAWLPAILSDDPATSLRIVAKETGPYPDIDQDYVVDISDLFVRGDQFINFDPTSEGEANLVDLSASLDAKRYPDETDANALFVDEGEDQNPPTKVYIRQDGIAALSISGRVVDNTPNSGTLRI